MKTKKNTQTWKSIHKWIGVLTSVFLLVFCTSGIILNHRTLFSSYSVPRCILPKDYRIRDFNNGIIKGTVVIDKDSLLAFGNCGIWLTDRTMSKAEDFNYGFPEGVDNRNIRNVVMTKDKTLWCATQNEVYRHNGILWEKAVLPDCKERITDIALNGDSCRVVALSRSAIYPYDGRQFTRIMLEASANHDSRTSLFKTFWLLHSGELFGTAGKIVVDIVAIVLIFLSLTGIILFIIPNLLNKLNEAKRVSFAKSFKWNFRWHDRIGYFSIILTILIVFTGMCLRPPLMIPLVLTKTNPLPGTVLDSPNAWRDKLRGIRWDDTVGKWLISTSDGFVQVNKDFSGKPELMMKTAPPVSPMGITVFESTGDGEWLIGSFSGLYKWNPVEGHVTDYFSGERYIPSKSMRPVSNHLITGFSKDLKGGEATFDYSQGCKTTGAMPEILSRQPMSLWNVALELHVGRCYNQILGPISALFIFISGTLLIIVLVSGLIMHKRVSSRTKV